MENTKTNGYRGLITIITVLRFLSTCFSKDYYNNPYKHPSYLLQESIKNFSFELLNGMYFFANNSKSLLSLHQRSTLRHKYKKYGLIV